MKHLGLKSVYPYKEQTIFIEIMDTTYDNSQTINETEQLVDMLLEKYISLTKVEEE